MKSSAKNITTVLFLASVLFSFPAFSNEHGEKKEEGAKSPTKTMLCVFRMGRSSFKKPCSGDDVRCGEYVNSSCSVKVDVITYFGHVKFDVAD